MRSAAILVLLISGGASAQRLEERLAVSSTAFAANGDIPRDFTCDGLDVSPPLAWSTVPADTKSVAIVVEDRDAGHVQWLVTGIPASTTTLGQGSALPAAALVGTNDSGKTGWTGPCPTEGRHHYVFTVYALDIAISNRQTKSELAQAMAGHVLAQGQLVGSYRRPPGLANTGSR
jgi:Raf kinase inhibitor-like YbhB/YbcL family protein